MLNGGAFMRPRCSDSCNKRLSDLTGGLHLEFLCVCTSSEAHRSRLQLNGDVI